MEETRPQAEQEQGSGTHTDTDTHTQLSATEHTHSPPQGHTSNEDTLTAAVNTHTQLKYTPEQQRLLKEVIAYLEKTFEPEQTHTYARFSQEAFKKLPTTRLMVGGKELTFLVDSGATYSVLSFMPNVKLSGRTVNSQGASGVVTKEVFTTPLTCVYGSMTDDEPDMTVKHSFLLSPVCPINLMGRDLMCALGLNLLSTPEGLQVHRQKDTMTMVHFSANTPLYVYQWRINLLSADDMLQLAAPHMNPLSDHMESEHMHCTAHVSRGPDTSYEEVFYRDLNDTLTTGNFYWTDNKSAFSVCLSSAQLALYKVDDAHPHVSISKSPNEQWRHLGPFMRRCETVSDWEKTENPQIMYSPSTNIRRTPYQAKFRVLRSVYLIDESNDTQTQIFTSMSPDDPELKDVPSTLWATHKYDVGLIKGCQPVVITPRSDYRPFRTQYPLKQEAIDGITPVFNSLLRSGVIVPCSDSPVRTPIFPVKKIRDKDQPTEWRFVQDLKAVNAAVHARAPHVPNPYTIMAQIPPSSKWFSVVDLSNAFFSVPVDKDSQYWSGL